MTICLAVLGLAATALIFTYRLKTDPSPDAAPATIVGQKASGTDKPIGTTPVFPAPPSFSQVEAITAPKPLPSWDKRWWIDKAARILRNGDTVGPSEDIERLETLSEDEIARHFMADSRFGDAILDFSMYFLGFKVDQLKPDGAYAFEAYDFANAINAAKAVINDGDYLTLFDLEGDYYMPPLTDFPTEDEKSVEDGKLDPARLRRKAVDELYTQLEVLIELVDNPAPVSRSELCDEIDEMMDQQKDIGDQLFRAFTDEEIFVLNRTNTPDFIFDGLQEIQDKECLVETNNQAETDAIENRLWIIYNQLHVAFDEIFKFEPATYSPDTVADFKPLKRDAFPPMKPWPIFGYKQSLALANSSTNFNRKRSAYMLKRFFCDDLTPVGFDAPEEHVSGSHGSQTSCFSCHFKLDPMAGFFRNYAANFSDVSGSTEIMFDDAAKMGFDDYLKNWRGPEQPKGTWDIGYIRSARWKDQNDYGSSLSDLSRIIRKAPEAKRCLMKRMTQYMLGENQTVDGAYLNALTADFEKEAEVNSSRALKNAMISVLKSDAFRQRNPDAQKCYDLVPGTVAEHRPPCRIAHILEQNCVQCHGKDMSLNQLDLTNWSPKPGGTSPNFTHLDEKGEQMKAPDTLAEIIKRLTSNDMEQRMPKNMTMPNQERQELFLWVQNELTSRKASQ